MSDKIKASPEWESEAVAKRLRETTSPGQPSSVQVFLNDEISANDLPEKAKEIVNDMRASLNLPADAIKIARVTVPQNPSRFRPTCLASLMPSPSGVKSRRSWSPRSLIFCRSRGM